MEKQYLMSRNSPKILIVDDDPVTCDLLCEVFEKHGFTARFEQNGESAVSALSAYQPDVVVSDIRMKTRTDGLNLLSHLRSECPNTPVILMTAFGSMDTAVRAVREGAFDYISKPFLIDQVVSTVKRALDTFNSTPKRIIEEPEDSLLETSLVGSTPAMVEIYKTIGKVANSEAPILITGESGTGKELIARAIHSH